MTRKLLHLCIAVFLFSLPQPAAGARPAWTSSRVQGSPYPPASYKAALAFPHLRFDLPTSIEEIPDAGRLLVTENGGKIYSFRKDSTTRQVDLVANLVELLPAEVSERSVSLLDAEFHPQFSQNRFLFVTYVYPSEPKRVQVSRFKVTADEAPTIVPGSEQVIIHWPNGPHKGGCLEFGTDGYLYISTGDGAGPNPPDGLTTGQDVSDLLGSVLRIDVDQPSDKGAYRVPADNPFLNLANVQPEIWAYGLRNPWKMGIDPKSGALFVADNGWETWESIYRIVSGDNCGWPIREGRAALRTEVTRGPTEIRPPVKDHHHSEANSVIGGPVYRGAKLPALDGAFVYGDYITGTIWMVREDRDGGYANATLVDTDLRISSFTAGSEGELFVLDYDFTGQVYELLPSGVEDTSATFPRLLSQTGIFSSLADLTPAAGVVPYRVTVNRWMDGAEATRWVAIPGRERIELAVVGETPAQYPDGTVFVKHLAMPLGSGRSPLRLETQILHFEDSTWRPYTYLWNEDGTDAQLVDSIGEDRPIVVTDPAGATVERTWHASATNECKLCHNPGSGFVLGFSLHQMDREKASGTPSRQLDSLIEDGVIGSVDRPSRTDPGGLVDPHDKSQSLEARARSYLHGNCAMCHHPQGNAIVSFFLRRDLPFDQLRTNKGTIIGTFGMSDAKIIVPGDPYRSILFYRMSKLGYARMPYIGSSVVDSDGVALIEEWIRSMSPSSAVSAPATAGSAEASAVLSLAGNETTPTPDQAIGSLLASTEGALALASQMHRGHLSPAERSVALRISGQVPTNDVRGLFETFRPESERRAVLGARFDLQEVLRLEGDQERGQLIFFSDSARCRSCHEFDDRSKSVGPTLAEVNKKYPRRADFLQHVVQPSLKIDDAYAAYTIVTSDGRLLSGLITEQTGARVTIKTAEKQVVQLRRDEIEEMRRSPQSLMPERMLSDLTAQEAADLLRYVRSVK